MNNKDQWKARGGSRRFCFGRLQLDRWQIHHVDQFRKILTSFFILSGEVKLGRLEKGY